MKYSDYPIKSLKSALGGIETDTSSEYRSKSAKLKSALGGIETCNSEVIHDDEQTVKISPWRD